MLSLIFTEKLEAKQDEQVFDELLAFPKLYEHDGPDFDTKISAYVGHRHLAEEIVEKLLALGLQFCVNFDRGTPFFADKFYEFDEKPSEMELAAVLSESVSESYPTDQQNAENNVPEQFVPRQQQPEMSTQVEVKPLARVAAAGDEQTGAANFVTLEQFCEFNRKRDNEMNKLANQMMQQMKQMQTMMAPTPSQNQNQSTSGNTTPVVPAKSGNNNNNQAKSAGYTAKNELVANGIRCEKCSQVVKGFETINLLIDAVRDHVLIHFDRENPMLKRFECRECGPQTRTNFVSEFEKHLGKHDRMRSLPEKRQQLTLTLLTSTHLDLITKLCNQCFPDVFERVPPPINSIKAIDVPSKARLAIYPNLDRAYCFQYKIPDKCGRRNSLPVPVIQLH